MLQHVNTIEPHTSDRSSTTTSPEVQRYARCIEASKRVSWGLDEVIKERTFDLSQAFMPDGLAGTEHFPTLTAPEMRFVSQIQGRTYANMFGLLERFVNAKVLEVSQDHWFGDQTKLEALIRFSDEEIKHQALFRRIETMIAGTMPQGYNFAPEPNPVARMILSKSTWSVLGLTLMVELVTQSHYRESIAPTADMSPLYKDVFHYHWLEESQHAIMDELEWRREDAKVSVGERDAGVDDLIALAGFIDAILQDQAIADAAYFASATCRPVDRAEQAAVSAGFLKAYRRQYIFSGAEHRRFVKIAGELMTPAQMQRIGDAVASLN
jgi:hypothetical protein